MAVLRVLVTVLAVVCWSSNAEPTLSIFQTAEIIASFGYPSETHHVTTSDGYILEMHRIPYGKGQDPTARRPVVFMMHGLTAASNAYIILGPEFAPAYNLADGGFDIWLGNARGNRNSRNHTTLNPDDSREKREFFDFTWEEIALIDVPAMINYVLEYTGQEKLHYIGHSQGGTVFLVLFSMMPEFSEKIISAHLLAGVGYQDYFPDQQLGTIARMTDVIYNMAVLAGFVEVSPPSTDELPLNQRLDHCSGDVKTDYMCELIGLKHIRQYQQMASSSRVDTNEILDVLANYESAGAALKQVAHYGQNIRDKSFRRWSYGTIRNQIIYGSRNPPEYDLSKITVKTTMHYTVNDNLLDERDVLAMAEVMPNTVVRKVARESFLHEDFVAATDARVLVTDYIVEALRRDSGLPSLDYTGPAEQNPQIPESEDVIKPEMAVTDSAHTLVLNSIFNMYLIGISIYFLLN